MEFFSEVHRALRAGGVFSFGLSGAENYANQSVRILGSAVHRSLASVFQNVLVIPGARQFLVASDRPLDYGIAARLQERGIATDYVREDYLRGKLTEDRIAAARENLSVPTGLNRDFFPVSYYAHLRYWLSQFGGGLLLPSLLVAAILILTGSLLAGSRRPVVAGALCSSAFAGMGLEVVLLLAFQICYGYVYHQIGLIVTAFLIGAAAGAFWSNRPGRNPSVLMSRLDGLLAGAALLLPPVLLGLRGIESEFWRAWIPTLIFPLLNGMIGFPLGAQFPAAARLILPSKGGRIEEAAGSLYAFDLLGASLGALFISVFCVPLMGITVTCCLVGGIKVLSTCALWRKRSVLKQPPGIPDPRRTLRAGRVGAFGTVTLAFAGLGLLMVSEDTNIGLYAFSFVPAFHWILVLLLAWGLLRAMDLDPFRNNAETFLRWARAVRHRTRIGPFRWLNFAAFAIVAFYPVFRCYFAIPYLFCHVCPRQCVFGFLRPYVVPAALIMNLEKRYWCYHACPIGTLYDCQVCVAGRPKRLRWLGYLALAALVFTAVSYFKLDWDLGSEGKAIQDWYTYFFKNRYSVSLTVIGVAGGLIAVAYRLRRSFCSALCPIGTFSDLMLRLERSLQKRGVFDG
jgi:hypothetical protein